MWLLEFWDWTVKKKSSASVKDIVYRKSDMKCSAFNLYYCMMT
jgi:hypothetical protein